MRLGYQAEGIFMDHLYYIGNASLVLRVIQHLKHYPLQVEFMTVIHQLDGWVVRVRCTYQWSSRQLGDLQAYLSELGVAYQPNPRLQSVLADLEAGHHPVEVMQRYQVAVIAHGQPEQSEVEAFRQQFIRGLGYCPETLG